MMADSMSAADPYETFRLFAEATAEGLIIHDGERVLAANEQFAIMFGARIEEVIGAPPFSFVIPADRKALEARARESRSLVAESMGLRLDGSQFPIESTGRATVYRGRPARVVRIRDLTSQKLAEATLKASEERFRATFELAAIGLAHVARDGRWLRVNRRLCEILGYDRDELLRITFQDVTHPHDIRPDLEQTEKVLAGKIDSYAMEKRYFRKDGSLVWANLTVALARNAAGEPDYFISIVEDISARKSMDERLRQAQKLEIIGQLTSGVAHDFGNFLNIIKGNLQLLERHQSESRAREYLSSALAGADMAEGLIRQLLSFSRGEEARSEPIEVNGLIDDLSGLLRRAAGEGILLVAEPAEAPCRVACDRTQMETALLNLVLNARDAIRPRAGKISIKTSISSLAPPGLPKSGNAAAEYVRITVADTGVGMPADVAARACEPFFTTKPAGSGTGLGLSQVARFVAQSHGVLDIDSAVDAGTAVSLFIPLISAP